MWLGLAVSFCVVTVAVSGQGTSNLPPERKYSVVRLQPTAFPKLPKNLVTELKRRGCTIPQPYTDRRANVIQGEFATPGQRDWAVLCSANGFSSILVLWNGSEKNRQRLPRTLTIPKGLICSSEPLTGSSSWITTGHTVGRSRRRLITTESSGAGTRLPWCCTTTGANG